jgi:uncharacterized membrane protein
MAATMDRSSPYASGRWHAFLLAGAFPLFLGAVLCDWAYARSFELQWHNFAEWLLAGGVLFLGIALVCALVEVVRMRRGGRALRHAVLLLVAFVLGLIASLVHARDAWAAMPAGFVLSVFVLLLVAAAAWMAFTGLGAGEPQ